MGKEIRYRLEFPLESFLNSSKEIALQDKTVRLVPNPNRNNLLDKAIIEIEGSSMDEARDQAHDTLSRYLSILSYEYDCPVHISGPPSCHETGPTKGGKTTGSVSHSVAAYIAGSARMDSLPDIAEYEPMQVALACYRDARNCTNEFHQYLSYYRVIENLLDVKGVRGRPTAFDLYDKLNQAGITVDGEPINQDMAREIYNDSRCALAHARKSKPTLIADRAEDLRKVRKGLQMIKNIARQCLEYKKRSLEDDKPSGRG